MPRPRLLHAVALCLGLVAAAALGWWARVEVTRLPSEVQPYYSTPQGDPLFHSADAFYHLRWSRAATAASGVQRAEDRPGWDPLSFAPQGRAAVFSLLQPLQAWSHRLWPGSASLATTAFYLPAMGSLLILAVLLWIGWRLGGVRAGIAAALLAAVHPELVSHTHAGMADAQYLSLALYCAAIGTLLPLADAWRERQRSRAAAWTLALFGTLALFAATWAGWWAAGLTALAFVAVTGLVELWPRLSGRWRLAVAAGVGGGGALAALLFVLTGAGRRLARYTGFKGVGAFPDGTTQVQELASLSPLEMVSRLGGWPILALAAIGIAWMLSRRDRRLAAVLLLLWAVPAMAAGFYALRFAVFAVPAVIVAAAWAAAKLAAKAARPLASGWVSRCVTAAVTVILLAAVAWAWRGHLQQLAGRRPAIDRAFAEIAETIAAESPPGALVNSWWDHGYALSALSGRGSVLDGGSYQSQRLYWLSLALSADDDDMSRNLLRAIDCGAETAIYERLREEFELDRAIGLVHRTFRNGQVAEVVRDLLANGVRRETGQEIYRLLDCDPPPAWLVVSSDLAAKTSSWASFGRWRFIADNPEPVPMISAHVPCQLISGQLECRNGYRADLERDGFEDRSAGGHYAAVGPHRPDGLVPVLHQHGRGLLLTFVRQELIDSLFVKLYFFHGHGVDGFELERVAHHPPFTQKVLLYRIDWQDGTPVNR